MCTLKKSICFLFLLVMIIQSAVTCDESSYLTRLPDISLLKQQVQHYDHFITPLDFTPLGQDARKIDKLLDELDATKDMDILEQCFNPEHRCFQDLKTTVEHILNESPHDPDRVDQELIFLYQLACTLVLNR